jgi:hypothetical protein
MSDQEPEARMGTYRERTGRCSRCRCKLEDHAKLWWDGHRRVLICPRRPGR